MKFRPVVFDREKNTFLNTEYLSGLFFLYKKYSHWLDDDFAFQGRNPFRYFLENIEKLSPYFWVVTDEKSGKDAGFIYLDNITGDFEKLHSAEVNACFFKNYWGKFVLETGIKFLRMCFVDLGFKKIKALVYPQNFRVKTLLNKLGFKKEAYLKSETVSRGRFQDIEIYSVIKER